MKLKVNKIDILFFLLLLTVGIRQACYKKQPDGFLNALSSFTFDLCNPEISGFVVAIISIVIPAAVLFTVFFDIYRHLLPFDRFIKEIVLHHFFFCFCTGCFLYSADIIRDFYATTNLFSENTSHSEWHKYIFHFILTPALFVDSVYSIEIQKIAEKEEGDVKKIKNKIYYASQVVTASYLIYCLGVVLYIEGQLGRVFFTALNLLPPEVDLGWSFYLNRLSNSAVECVFITLFFGLMDQGVVAEKVLGFLHFYERWTDQISEEVT